MRVILGSYTFDDVESASIHPGDVQNTASVDGEMVLTATDEGIIVDIVDEDSGEVRKSATMPWDDLEPFTM